MWMLLMVPVGIFAALVAMASPQRLIGESSLRGTADNLARFAAESHVTVDRWMAVIQDQIHAARQDEAEDPTLYLSQRFINFNIDTELVSISPPLPMDCQLGDSEGYLGIIAEQFDADDIALAELEARRDVLEARRDMLEASRQEIEDGNVEGSLEDAQDALEDAQDALRPVDSQIDRLSFLRDQLNAIMAEHRQLAGDPDDPDDPDDFEPGECRRIAEQVSADLGILGFDLASLRGYYIDFDGNELPSWRQHVCPISYQRRVVEAVRVAVTADWKDAGWAAAQVWPDGIVVATESIGASVRSPKSGEQWTDDRTTPSRLDCRGVVDAVDPQGHPSEKRDPWSGKPRMPFSG